MKYLNGKKNEKGKRKRKESKSELDYEVRIF